MFFFCHLSSCCVWSSFICSLLSTINFRKVSVIATSNISSALYVLFPSGFANFCLIHLLNLPPKFLDFFLHSFLYLHFNFTSFYCYIFNSLILSSTISSLLMNPLKTFFISVSWFLKLFCFQ